ncbi:MAG: Lrp/AsnC family transcriptional regulator [Vannielia sp.]|uniref:Lrp/AsnC family transcriptional regulator n=1 Tax=Rhodobacterales TaxID=204455 RepID=UPI0020954AE0|nr:Lrp/AsnC family transcriptional regulator [Oceanicola sp. 502str15]MCO6382935.1 AsnC family transcriptional regulator [Oceanicola sp. 502str15]
MTLDATDSALLRLLQQDANQTAEALGARLGLSPSQAGRRRQRLEATGLIAGYHARVEPEAVGLGVQAMIQVHMAAHAPDAAQSFARLVERRDEIVSAWVMTGDADYLLRIYCNDLPALNRLVQEVLLPHPSVARVQSQIVMAQLKPDGPLPL